MTGKRHPGFSTTKLEDKIALQRMVGQVDQTGHAVDPGGRPVRVKGSGT